VETNDDGAAVQPAPCKQRPPDLGPLASDITRQAPDLMKELTQQFIDRKDLNSRVRLRLRFKAVLDLISVDTEYPPVPALNPMQERGPQIGDAIYAGGAPVLGMGGRPLRRAIQDRVMADGPAAPAVAPIPGAEQAMDNDLVLGG